MIPEYEKQSLNYEKVQASLEALSSDCSYDDWQGILNLIAQSESETGQNHEDLARQWSQRDYPKYRESHFRSAWKTAQKKRGNGKGIGALIELSGIDPKQFNKKGNAPYRRPFVVKPLPKPKPINPPTTVKEKISLVSPLPQTKPTRQNTDYGYTLTWKYWYSDSQFVKRIDYYDKQGQRTIPPNADDDNKTKWIRPFTVIDGKEKIGDGDRPWTAYRLDQAIKANSKYIIAFEGEKCCEYGWLLGLPSITFRNSVTTEEMAEIAQLIKDSEKTVIIIPDLDKTGKQKAIDASKAFSSIDLPYVIFDLSSIWTDISEKSDIADWIQKEMEGGKDYQEIGKILANNLQKILKNPCIPDWLNLEEKSSGSQPDNKVVPLFEGIISCESLIPEIDSLIEKDLPQSKLTAKLNELSQKSGVHTLEIRKIYQERLKESEIEETRNDTANELNSLLEANNSSIPLNSVIPESLSQPLERLAKWLNLRPEAYLTALLTGLSSCHHPETKLILNKAWDFEVSPNLFSAIVAPSSQKKSPILKAMVTKPLRELHRKAREEFKEKQAEYQEKINRYEALKRSRKEEDQEALKEEFPEGKPKEPRQRLHYFTNQTGEGIINQAAAFPDQGLLYLKDELAGVFKSANQYRGGRGSDEEDLLSYYDGTGGTVLRASGTTADVDGLLLSVLGTTQPKVLQKLLEDGEDSNGKWARFIFVNQPLAASKMADDNGSINLNPLLTWLYENLNSLRATTYRLSRDAFKLFYKAYNRLEEKRTAYDTSPEMSHVWGKSEGRIGKLAINLHCIKYLMDEQIPPEEINRETIKAAIALTNFYAQQVQSLYTALAPTDQLSTHLLKTLEIASRKGDWITAREVYQSLNPTLKKTVKSDQIRSWFKELEAIGKGQVKGTGNRLQFKSVDTVDSSVDKKIYTPNPSYNNESSQSVDTVDSVDTFSKPSSLSKNTYIDKQGQQGQQEIPVDEEAIYQNEILEHSIYKSTNPTETINSQGVESVDSEIHSPIYSSTVEDFYDGDFIEAQRYSDREEQWVVIQGRVENKLLQSPNGVVVPLAKLKNPQRVKGVPLSELKNKFLVKP